MRKILVRAYNEINAEVIHEAWNQAIEQVDLPEEEGDIDGDDVKEEGSDEPQEEEEIDDTDHEKYNNLSDEDFCHIISIVDEDSAESYKDEEESYKDEEKLLEIEFQKHIIVQTGNSINTISDSEFKDFVKTIFESEGKNYDLELWKFIEDRKESKCIEKPNIFAGGVFNISKARRLLSIYEVAANRNIEISELNEYPRTLTSSLVLNVSNDR